MESVWFIKNEKIKIRLYLKFYRNKFFEYYMYVYYFIFKSMLLCYGCYLLI